MVEALEDLLGAPDGPVAAEAVFEGPLVGAPVAEVWEVRRGEPVARARKEGTMGIVPPRYNKDKKNLPAYVPLPVTPETRGIIWLPLKNNN